MRPSTRARGFGLVEVLVAVALLSLGVAGLLQLHASLRGATEQARLRGEALRLAESDLEQLRVWRSVDGMPGPSWTAISALSDQAIAQPSSTATFRLDRSVALQSTPLLKSVTSTVRWHDRDDQAQSLGLSTRLAALDPALAGALLVARGDTAAGSSAAERHPLVPAPARDLGDGRLAFKPRREGTRVWVFDPATAAVTQRCSAASGLVSGDLDAASLGDCRPLSGLLLAGHVRFATQADTLGAGDAEQPLSPAMTLDLRLTLTSTGHPDPAWECEDDAPDGVPPATTTQLDLRYWCVVQPAGNPPRWSGRLELVASPDWSIGTAAGQFRVCRYSADRNGNGTIDNPEHPASYRGVDTPLGDQNFLVIRATASCPRDVSTGPWTNWIDDSTVAHQP